MRAWHLGRWWHSIGVEAFIRIQGRRVCMIPPKALCQISDQAHELAHAVKLSQPEHVLVEKALLPGLMKALAIAPLLPVHADTEHKG